MLFMGNETNRTIRAYFSFPMKYYLKIKNIMINTIDSRAVEKISLQNVQLIKFNSIT